jgi:hypothetical protein
MQVPSETRPAIWGAAGGAVALAIVGFVWGGWTATSTANKLADERVDSAVVAVLTSICVEKFQQSGDARANLAALIKISSSWEQEFHSEGRLGNTPGSYFF